MIFRRKQKQQKEQCSNYFNLGLFQQSDLELTLTFTKCCPEINHGHSKMTLQGHPEDGSSSKESVIPNYWRKCGKNSF